MKRFFLINLFCIAIGAHFVPFANAGKYEINPLDRPIQYAVAKVIAKNIPGPSAVSQVGTFLSFPNACAEGPIPNLFPQYVLPGAVLDPKRILVCNKSNFGAPLARKGMEGSIISINPGVSGILCVPSHFAKCGGQASALRGNVQMFSANSPAFLNRINNPQALTASYTGVGNPLGLSNNNSFGRVWPANSPFGARGSGTTSILDPTGIPFKNLLNNLIGGVFVGSLTDRNNVTTATEPHIHPGYQPQVIPGSISTGAVGIAFLGGGPNATCTGSFAVVTADGAIVQAQTAYGVDGLAPPGTINPLIGKKWKYYDNLSPRLGVLMNPYNLPRGVLRQLFISEPYTNTIAVVDLVPYTTIPDGYHTVFKIESIRRLHSSDLNLPIDMSPTKINSTDTRWASNTTLDRGSDIYVANRGDNTIVRMDQQGRVITIRKIRIKGEKNYKINGIATSFGGTKIYVTFVRKCGLGGVAKLKAF